MMSNLGFWNPRPKPLTCIELQFPACHAAARVVESGPRQPWAVLSSRAAELPELPGSAGFPPTTASPLDFWVL